MSQDVYEDFQAGTEQELYYNTDSNMPTTGPGPPLPNRDAKPRSTKDIELKDQCNTANRGYEPDYRTVQPQEGQKSENTNMLPTSQEKSDTKRVPCSLVTVVILTIVIAVLSLGVGMGIMYGLSQSVLKYTEKGKGGSLVTEDTIDTTCTEPEKDVKNTTDFLLPYNTYRPQLYVTATENYTKIEIHTRGRGSYDIDNVQFTSALKLQEEETFTWKNDIYWAKADLISITADKYVYIVVQFMFNDLNYDSYYSLPDSMLGYSYTVNMRPSSAANHFPLLYITAGNYDETLVEFFSTNNYVTSIFDSQNLTARQQVVFKGNSNAKDFTGLEIRSTRPVAVVNSHQCFHSPAGSNYLCGRIAEQSFPDNMLGRLFIIPKFLSAFTSDGYFNVYTRVLALNETKVNYQYGDTSPSYRSTLLQPGEFNDQHFATPVNITCSIPCSVVSYLHYYTSTSNRLPPSMLIIPGTNLFKIGRTYFSSNMTTSQNHEVNLAIVTNVGGNSHMFLNGVLLTTEWSTVLGTYYIYTVFTSLPRKATNVLENGNFNYTAYLYGGDLNSCSFSQVVALNID